jgi:hypothetical protein
MQEDFFRLQAYCLYGHQWEVSQWQYKEYFYAFLGRLLGHAAF